MADVRASVGVPVAAQFGGRGAVTDCAALVVNSSTGRPYTLTSADAVVAVALGTGTASGTNTGDQTITLTGGVTGSGTGTFAATVVTNANLTGPITSTGNATAVAAQTGTGSTFVMNTSPTIVTPTLTQEAATTPTLLNSWVDFGGGYRAVSYWKDSQGVVHLQGAMKSGTTTSGTNLFSLASGYRPPSSIILSAIAPSGVCAGINIDSSGNVSALDGVSATYTSIEGLSFRT